MSQKKPSCLAVFITGTILLSMPFLICGGCLVGGGAIVHQANEHNARIEAAKTPAQKAKEAAKKKEDDIDAELRFMAEKLMMRELKYPLEAKMPKHPRCKKMGPNEYSVTGVVDAKNAFGVRERKNWVIVFNRENEKADWTWSEVGFWAGE